MKRTGNVVQLMVISTECNGDDVETDLQIELCSGEVHIGGTDQVFLFLWGDKCLRFSEIGTASCFHLANNKRVLIPGNHIYFQMITVPVSFKDGEAVLNVKICRKVFSSFANLMCLYFHS